MAKRSLIEELNRAVEGMIRNPDAPLPEVDSRIAPLIRIAADLCHLPATEFQSRLKNELLASGVDAARSTPVELDETWGGRLDTDKELRELQKQLPASVELAASTELVPQDVRVALEALPEPALKPAIKRSSERPSRTEASDGIEGTAGEGGQAGSLSYIGVPERSMRVLASLDQCTVGVARFSDQTPLWERHPDGEELLHVLEGDLDVTTLTDEGPVHTTVPAGSFFVCPQGLWHWSRPQPSASLLFVTPGKGTESSRAEHPKPEARRPLGTGGARTASGGRRKPRPESQAGRAEIMRARDIKAALSEVPVLAISDSTTGEEAGAAFPQLGSLNQAGLYAGRFSGLSPWERHTSADELLYILEGEVEITTLTDGGPVRNTLRAGSVFVCPRGLWHRQYSAAGALSFSATPQPTQISFADDPRV